jgi:hypothetical protein
MQSEQKYNPFQRNYSNNRSDGPRGRYQGERRGGYQSWKNPTVQPPKEKVLTADDFPALPTAISNTKRVADKNSWEKPDMSMAERMKEQLEKEEENRLKVKLEEKEEKLDVIPLSSWMHNKYIAKKRAEEEKRREMEAEEANYRWQISPEIEQEYDEVEMPELHNEEEGDSEEECIEEESKE